jgi:hypothetical protein
MDRLSKVLEACLDTTYNHPAWITDQLGAIIALNNCAIDCNVSNLDFQDGKVCINGVNYKHTFQELNHGTNCFLHELVDEEDLNIQLQKSIDSLEAAINRRNKNSIKL